MSGKKVKNLFNLENLEPRIMLSADPLFGLLQTLAPDASDALSTPDSQPILAEEIQITMAELPDKGDAPDSTASFSEIFSGMDTDTPSAATGTEEGLSSSSELNILQEGTDAVSSARMIHLIPRESLDSDLVLDLSDTLSGTGTIHGDVVNSGVVSPGNSPGMQTMDTYTQSLSGTLRIEIAGETPGVGYDQINVTGQAVLDGTLEIVLLDDVVLKVGDTFDIMTYGSVSGSFSHGTGLTGFGDGNLYFDVVQKADRLQLVVKETLGGGDFHITGASTSDLDNLGIFFNHDYFTESALSVSFSAMLNISDYVYLNGTFSFGVGGMTALDVATGLPSDLSGVGDDVTADLSGLSGISDDYATIEDLEMEIFTLGVSDVNAFVGFSGPYFIDSNDDGLIDENDTPDEDVFGFVLNDFDLGLMFMEPELAMTPGYDWLPSFYAGAGHADSFAFKGLAGDQFCLETGDIALNFNSGSGWALGLDTPVVNFLTSFESAKGAGDGSFELFPGSDDALVVNFDGKEQMALSVTDAVLGISDFFRVRGDFTFESRSDSVLLSDGLTAEVDMFTLAAGDVDAFAGVNGSDADRSGLSLSSVDFVLALMTDRVDADRTWTSLQAQAESAAFEGVEGLTISATTLSVEINRAAVDGTLVDYASQSLVVATGPSKTMTLTMDGDDGQLLRASGHMEIDAFGFFVVEGGFAFEKSTETVNLSDETTATVDLMTLGGTNVDAFAGINGGTANQMGFALGSLDFALALLSDQADPARQWTSLEANAGSAVFAGIEEANAGSAAFAGIDGLTISATTLAVEINRAATDGTLVDYASQGLMVTTGPDKTLTLTMDGEDGELLRASGHMEIDAFGFFMVEGGFAFEKSTEIVVLSDETTATVDLMTLGGANVDAFAGINGGTATPLGFALGSLDFALALLSDQADPSRQWTYGGGGLCL